MKTSKVDIVSLKLVREKTVQYEAVNSGCKSKNLCRKILSDSPNERFLIVGLDSALQPTVIYFNEGSEENCGVSVRTAMKVLLLANSTRFIIAHNHPALSLEFSQDDISTTKAMKNAAELLGIKLLDHILVCGDESAAMSLIYPEFLK